MGFLKSFSSDDALLEGFLAGSDASFEALIGRHAEKLFSAALCFSNSLDLAEQIVTEVFYRAYRDMPHTQARTTVRFWLYRLLVTVATEFSDDIRIERQFSLATGEQLPKVSEEKVSRERLLTELVHLTEELRSVFILKDVIGFDKGQVAEILEIDLDEVQLRLCRARLLILSGIRKNSNDEQGTQHGILTDDVQHVLSGTYFS